MPETPETAEEIQEIRFRMESIEGTQQLLLRDHAHRIREAIIRDVFSKSPAAVDVYLTIDGSRNQTQIIEQLRSVGIAFDQSTVSRALSRLDREGLIEKYARGGRIVWKKKDVVERVLKLTQHLNRLKKTNARDRDHTEPKD